MDHSEIFTMQTKPQGPPCNIARIVNACPNTLLEVEMAEKWIKLQLTNGFLLGGCALLDKFFLCVIKVGCYKFHLHFPQQLTVTYI